MDSWICGSHTGFLLAGLEAIYGLAIVFSLSRAHWRVRAKEDWATFASFVTLVGFVGTLPLATHVVFDGPDLCRMSDSGEFWGAFRFYFQSGALVILALSTPRFVTPRHPIQTRWGPFPPSLRFAIVVAGWLLLGQAVWHSVYSGGLASSRIATIWAVGMLGVLLLGLGRLVDGWVADPWRRLPVALMAAPFLTYATAWMLQRDHLADSAPPANADDWYAAALARLQAIPKDGPVLLVAASGGGSHAATFGTLVLETLSQPPDQLFAYADATHTVPTHFSHPLSDYVWMLSGVSGGSVAVAHHVATHYGNGGRGQIGTGAEMLNGYRSAFAPQGVPSDVGRLTGNLLRTHQLDDVLADFNAPALLGMLSPVSTRGSTLASFWNAQYGWESSFRAPSTVPRPLVIFNATLAASGRRLMIGEPPIPQSLLSSWLLSRPADIPMTAISRITPVSLASISPTVRPTIGTAVRMSASFPWGMDMATVTTPAVPGGGDRPDLPARDLVVGDGGMVDNTGTASLTDILRGLRAESVQNADAREILHELDERGVVVVEIDSGAKPVPERGILARVLEPALGPADALNSADYTRERMAVMLRRRDLSGIISRSSWAAFAYCPKNAADTITTAWALGPQEKATLLQQFADRTLSGRCFAGSADLEGPQDPTLHASPLNEIATAFQPDHVQPAADAAVLNTLPPGDERAAPIAWTLMDRALRYYDVELAHTTAVRTFGAGAATQAAFETADVALRGAERIADVGVVSLDFEERLDGWIAARRYQPDGNGVVSLLWSKIDIPAAVQVTSLPGDKVQLARRITVHSRFPDGPGDIPVALATDRAQVTVREARSVTVGKDRWDYLHVAWDPAHSLSLPCPATSIEITWCNAGGDAAHRDALALATALQTAPTDGDLATGSGSGCIDVRESGDAAFLAPALDETGNPSSEEQGLWTTAANVWGRDPSLVAQRARARAADGFGVYVCPR